MQEGWTGEDFKKGDRDLTPLKRRARVSSSISGFLLPEGHCGCSFTFFLLLFLATPSHMEVPRLGVELELQLPAYTTAPSNAASLTH